MPTPGRTQTLAGQQNVPHAPGTSQLDQLLLIWNCTNPSISLRFTLNSSVSWSLSTSSTSCSHWKTHKPFIIPGKESLNEKRRRSTRPDSLMARCFVSQPDSLMNQYRANWVRLDFSCRRVSKWQTRGELKRELNRICTSHSFLLMRLNSQLTSRRLCDRFCLSTGEQLLESLAHFNGCGKSELIVM